MEISLILSQKIRQFLAKLQHKQKLCSWGQNGQITVTLLGSVVTGAVRWSPIII